MSPTIFTAPIVAAVAAGALLTGVGPAQAAEPAPATLFFLNSPSPTPGTCDVVPVLIAAPGQPFRYVVIAAGQMPLSGEQITSGHGEAVLAVLLVPDGTQVIATATGANPAHEIVTC